MQENAVGLKQKNIAERHLLVNINTSDTPVYESAIKITKYRRKIN